MWLVGVVRKALRLSLRRLIQELHTLLVGTQNGVANTENRMGIPKKLTAKATIWSSNDISVYLAKEQENTNLKRNLYSHVHCRTICYSQDMEAT